MATPSRTPSLESPTDGSIRKRVCKACDRCRLKKSKCDGLSPCSRCRADNAICVFGERKKSHDKVYPKGYVEMLEQQQEQLIAGLRMMYTKVLNKEGWIGAPLAENSDGHPWTHDILQRLDLLHMNDAGDSPEVFEESFSKLQKRLLEGGAKLRTRRGSISSDSEHAGNSQLDSPPPTATNFKNPFKKLEDPPTPPIQSSFPQVPRTGNIKNASSPPTTTFTPPPFLRAEMNTQSYMRNEWPQDTSILSEASMYNEQFASPATYNAPQFAFDQQFPTFDNALGLNNTFGQYGMDWSLENDDFQSYLHPGINV